ncbi:MAG TPA: hypothetical protein VFM68_03130 [Candidatus Saccharimonadales bacterium]|nr:hypothetical protein [Candidatus Saccharimonadales bacterium]
MDRLNKMLLDKPLDVYEIDTARAEHMELDGTYETAWPNRTIEVVPWTAGNTILFIPVRSGYRIWLKPLELKGKLYPAMIDIKGDRVTGRMPYWYGTPTRVEYFLFGITVRRQD